ncbi:Autoinducer 2 sensor kinase/phosphatase LuxQ [Anaerohalosphaera lusitana]|uniref:Sensory/regulatory protein RpfC n=1 Tax=Anaerohalosphaera lusitana TaxID=1936003 RepID=A0A1U9NKS4_9BACT|nr:PhnD/SsuA/transferrin family substrate-binding protein [Anaerohalosphaera lusitana]AQT68190.1 Autoinducer 2 sensor kinase/phosphatase LuxQ [Anaerohalosphaera lusitana]
MTNADNHQFEVASKRIKLHIFALVLGILCVGELFNTRLYASESAVTTDSSDTFKVGVLANKDIYKCIREWQSTADYLSDKLNRQFILVPLKFKEIDEASKNKRIDFLIGNTYIGILTEINYSAKPIATLARKGPEGILSRYAGVIFCRSDNRDINKLSDIKGNHIAAVDRNSFGGWIMAQRLFKKSGINLSDRQGRVKYTKNHETVVKDVLSGTAAAGLVRTGVLESMAERGLIDIEEIKVLNSHENRSGFPYLRSTRLYPEWPFMALEHISEETALNVAIALLNMPAGSGVGIESGFEGWAVPQNDREVHLCLKELRIGPYENYFSNAMLTTLRHYWPILIALAILILVVIAFAAHIHRNNIKLNRVANSVSEKMHSIIETKSSSETQKILHAKSVNCHKAMKCNNTSCPAYKEDEPVRCWEIVGTFCNNTVQGNYAQKLKTCKSCQVYKDVCKNPIENLSLSFNTMLSVLAERETELKTSRDSAISLYKESEDSKLAAECERAKLKSMISGMEEGVVFADPDNVIVEVNDYFCSFLNIDQKEIIGKSIDELHNGNVRKRVLEMIDQYRTRQKTEPLTIQRAIGKSEVILRVQPIYRNDDYDGVLLNVIDVTELVEAKKNSEQAKCELEKTNQYLEMQTAIANDMAAEAEMANAYKSQFLANMSHEIRTPMNAIIGFSEMLAEEPLDHQQKTHVDIVRNSATNLLNIINDILDYSKIEAGKLDVDKKTFSLNELLRSVESMMHARAVEKEIEFKILEETSLPPKIFSDPNRLNQCLINLVNNAVKFTDTGHVYVRVRNFEESGNQYISLSVEDTGIGISKARQQSIFESFTQEDGSTTRKYGGTGLGLTITKKLTELMDGTLTLESTKGEGSIFTITIPSGIENLKSDSPNLYTYKQKKSEFVKDEVYSFKGEVLVAEDVKTNQLLIKQMLSKLGVSVTIVGDGKKAVDQTEKDRYDLIFLDIQMPHMNGYEAAKLIKKRKISVPIVALTANAMSGDKEKCLANGFDDYLSKPIQRGELIRILDKHIERSSENPAESAKSHDRNSEIDRTDINTSEEDLREGLKLDLNWTELVARAGGIDNAEMLIEIWHEDMCETIAELKQAVSRKDRDRISSLAHKIKGSAANITVESVRKNAETLELSALNCSFKEIEGLIETFESFTYSPKV